MPPTDPAGHALIGAELSTAMYGPLSDMNQFCTIKFTDDAGAEQNCCGDSDSSRCSEITPKARGDRTEITWKIAPLS